MALVGEGAQSTTISYSGAAQAVKMATPASRSYGLQVARLAGVPAAVVQHAKHALAALEASSASQQHQVDLFAPPPPAAEPETPPALAALAAIDPDALSPREALDHLYQLKKLALKS